MWICLRGRRNSLNCLRGVPCLFSRGFLGHSLFGSRFLGRSLFGSSRFRSSFLWLCRLSLFVLLDLTCAVRCGLVTAGRENPWIGGYRSRSFNFFTFPPEETRNRSGKQKSEGHNLLRAFHVPNVTVRALVSHVFDCP